jgi:hypothetical protein
MTTLGPDDAKFPQTRAEIEEFYRKFMLPKPAVGNSLPFWTESPFQTFTPKFQPEFVVVSFDELSEMEIRSKKGVSCRRLPQTKIFAAINKAPMSPMSSCATGTPVVVTRLL